jgi:hypothetical protein
MDDCQPVALRASALNVSIAVEVSQLVSSSVERRRLNRANLLHQIIDRRKLLAVITSSKLGMQWQIPVRDGGSFPEADQKA